MPVPEDALEFRILGSFEAFARGRPLEIGAGKQRALLVVLLLNNGEIVSTDRLIDALWEESPPASALNSVHVYISQLRKTLGNGRLETHGHGYLLALEPEQIDLGRFERLLGEGRASRWPAYAGAPSKGAAGRLRTDRAYVCKVGTAGPTVIRVAQASSSTGGVWRPPYVSRAA